MIDDAIICKIFLIISLMMTSILFAYEMPPGIMYVHPTPSSEHVMPQSTIIIKFSDEIDNISQVCFTITGDKSGCHSGEMIVSDHTLIFKPDRIFDTSEMVHVSVQSDLPGWEKPYEFVFKIQDLTENNLNNFCQSYSESMLDNSQTFPKNQPETYGQRTVINGVSVPSDFPVFEPTIIEEGIAPGRLFLATYNGPPYYIMILENDGTPYFYRRVQVRAQQFKLLPNGQLLCRTSSEPWGYGLMDSSYNFIRIYNPANGYLFNVHDFYMAEDGHYFLIVDGFRKVDMSQVVPGGQSDATVIDNHIQEFDQNGNLVFEWLSYEHLNLEDSYYDLTQNQIDYVHMNSIAVDYDGHIIASCRYQNAVIKIHRQTGEILWFLGGTNNDFEFVNDEYGISQQHHASPVPGQPNHYTIFDNGNDHNPRFSRGVEYYLDLDSMQATLVWEYRHTPDLYANWMGSVQRLTNGNSLVNFVDGHLPKAIEVTPDGDVVYEADFLDNVLVYRTFRFEWDSPTDRPYLIIEPLPDKVSLVFNQFGDPDVDHYVIYAGLDGSTLNQVATTSDPFFDLYELQNDTRYSIAVTSVDNQGNESEFSNIEDVLVRFANPGDNIIYNGNFSSNLEHWQLILEYDAAGTGSVNDDGQLELNLLNGGNDIENVKLIQEHIPLIQGCTYRLEFDARAAANRLINVRLERSKSPWDNYSCTDFTTVGPQMRHYSFEFEMDDLNDYDARLVFSCGNCDIDLFLDNIFVSFITNSVDDNKTTNASFELYTNYPNPFNPTTTIEYAVPRKCHIVEIKIYDLLGREVRTLVAGVQNAGNHHVTWNGLDKTGSSVASGVYFYTMTAEGFTETRKLLLLR